MGFSQEDLELRALRALSSDKSAILQSQIMEINSGHFNGFRFNEEKERNFGDSSLTRAIFSFINNYFDKSSGSLLTSTVMETYVVQNVKGDKFRAALLQMWSAIEEEEYDPNDVYAILTELKRNRAMEHYHDFIIGTESIMTGEAQVDSGKTGLDAWLDYQSTAIEKIRSELGGSTDRSSIDMAESSEYFEKEYEYRVQHPELYRGIPCGVQQIDDKTFGWMGGQLIVVLGPSSGGKSVILLNWAHHAHLLGYNVLYLSFELDKWTSMIRHVSLALQVPFSKIKSISLDADEAAQVVTQLSALKDGPYFEYDLVMDDKTPEYVEAKIQQLTMTKGKPDLVVVDYVGEMSTRAMKGNEEKWKKNEAAAEGLWTIARKYDLPVITAQQFTRDAIKETHKQKESNKPVSFNQAAISGGQTLMHRAWYAIALNPDRENGFCELQGVKMRDAWFNPMVVRVNPEYNQILELTDDEQIEQQRTRGMNVTLPKSDKEDMRPVTKISAKTTQEGIEVEWSGGSETYTEQDLILPIEDEMDDWAAGLVIN